MRPILYLITITLYLSCSQNSTNNEVEELTPAITTVPENIPLEKAKPKKPFLEYFNVITVDSFSIAQYNLDRETAYQIDSLELEKYLSFYDDKKEVNHKNFGLWYAFGMDTTNANYYSLFFWLGSDSEALLQVNYSKADSTEIARIFVAEQYNGCAEYGEITTKKVNDHYLQTEVNRYMDEKVDSVQLKYRWLQNGTIDTITYSSKDAE